MAVVVDIHGSASPPVRVERTDEGRWDFLSYLDRNEGLDVELVMPDWVARADGLPNLATARGMSTWIAPMFLIDAVRVIAHAQRPASIAALIARLPLARGFREHLRRVGSVDQRQLSLL